jgi:iron complex transport system substrate-binding protein
VAACRHEEPRAVRSNAEALHGRTFHRIVSLAPNLTEMLFFVGAGDKLVGRTSFCDYPPEALEAPVVGGGVDLDLERILEPRPDLVVALEGLGGRIPAAVLDRAGIAVYITRVETGEDVVRTVRELGILAGDPGQAAAAADGLAASLAALAGRACPPRVLMVHGHRPLVAAGPGSWGDEVLRLAGYRNALAGTPKSYPVLDLEQVVALSPDLVIDTSFAEEAEGMEGFWKQFAARGRAWQVLFLSDPALLRPGPRVALAVALVAQRLDAAGGCAGTGN